MRLGSTPAWLLLALVACSPSAPPDYEPPGTGGAGTPHPVRIPEPRPLRAPPPAPGDMPSPDACTADADCRVVVAGPDPDHPCCDRLFGTRPTSVAFLDWADRYQLENCGDVHCGSLPYPSVPPTECAMQARCREGRCASACDDAAPSTPGTPAHGPTKRPVRPGTEIRVGTPRS